MKNITNSTFTKERKFTLMRRYSLLVAGIPGMVLAPFLLGWAITSTALPTELKNAITNPMAIFTGLTIMPGIFAMLALVILAIVTATQKPTDPDSPTPKTKRLQIILGASAALMPTIAFLDIFRYSFRECGYLRSCTIFDAPTVAPTAMVYAAIWIALAIIWLRNKSTAKDLR